MAREVRAFEYGKIHLVVCNIVLRSNALIYVYRAARYGASEVKPLKAKEDMKRHTQVKCVVVFLQGHGLLVFQALCFMYVSCT